MERWDFILWLIGEERRSAVDWSSYLLDRVQGNLRHMRQYPILLVIGGWEDTTHGWWLPLRLWRRLHVRFCVLSDLSLIHQSIVKNLIDFSPGLSRRERFMVTERKVLSVVGFDVGFPLSYRLKYKYFCIFFDRELRDVFCQTRFPSLRYLRRYGRVCHISMPVLTLARLNQIHLTNIDIHLLLGIFWSLALWNTASTSKSVNQRWIYWRIVGILAPAKPRLRWRPSSWPWRWRTLRWGLKHRRIVN